MPLYKRLLCLAALVLVGSLKAAPVAFPQDESDLKPDPKAHFAMLPNGVRTIVISNKEPRGRASLRLLVQAGSLNEDEDQRGLAHFLEHMAFNGSTHYPPGTLVELLQRMGMGFGADTNASTSFDRTVYQLELPDTRPETLGQGIQIFADYAGGLLITPEKIEKERGIILSEKRDRDSVEYRNFVAQFGFLLAGTRLPERLPIGLSPVITDSKRDRFVRFYDTWYRPEKLTVIVVGDFTDTAAVERTIAEDFGPLKARAPAPKPIAMGTLPSFTGVQTLYHPEPEAPETSVSISTVTPYTREPDTSTVRLRYLPRMLANEMINRRLAILSKKENAPFIRGEADADEEFNFLRNASISLDCKADQWTASLAVAEQELRRALNYGFQPAELHEAVADFANNLEQAAKSAPTRRSDEVSSGLVQSIMDRQVFTDAAQDLALYGPALKTVTVEDCLRALRIAWSANHRSVSVIGNAKLPSDPDAAIQAAYKASASQSVTAPDKRVDAAWAYTDFGPAGSVVSTTPVKDLGITEVVFSNGVRLNLKRTEFQANTIVLRIRAGSGLLSEPPSERGLNTYAGATFVAGGLGKHSADDLTRILAGHTVDVSFQVGTDAFILGGATNREDLLLELQLLTATLVDPGYRPESQRNAAKEIEAAYLSMEHTSDGPFSMEVPSLLAGGDPRFGLPPKPVMLSRTLDEVRAWVGPQLARGPLEIALVGDLDEATAVAAVASTLGALPPRQAPGDLAALKHLTPPSTPLAKTYSIPSEIPKGALALFWPTNDGLDVHRSRRLNLLAAVLTDRLRVKVREQMGGAYSPYAISDASNVFPGYGYLSAHLTVDPDRVETIEQAVAMLGLDLSKSGVTNDELSRAKNPIITSLKESARTNQYWINVVSQAQGRPEVLDWARTRETDFESITVPEIDALAKSYLDAARASRFKVLPARSK